MTEARAELTHLLELVAKTEQSKLNFLSTKDKRDYRSIAAASETLNTLRAKVAKTRKFLEPLVMSCPFCLWSCTTQFVSNGGQAQPEVVENSMGAR